MTLRWLPASLPAVLSKGIAVGIGTLTMASVIVLLMWDGIPERFPASAHLVLGAVPLALIAVAYLVYQVHIRASRARLVRAVILAFAFMCWAENQLLGDGRLATLFNDLAIGLFVFDVFLTMVGWPKEKGAEPEVL